MKINQLPDRIRQKIRIDANSQCWLWTAMLNPKGYGKSWRDDLQAFRLAHRVVWEYLRGAIPEGMQLDHLCRVRRFGLSKGTAYNVLHRKGAYAE